MNKFLKVSITALTIILVAGVLNSCKKKFDEPPYATDPAITPTHTIKAFKALHTATGVYDLITSDIIISGVVISSDKSGNIYKQLFIQDSTGALQINVDIPNLYATYPLGRKVFIKCKGLYLTDVSNMMQLGVKSVVNGNPSIDAIPAPLAGQYIVGGSLDNPITTYSVTSAQLGTTMQDKYLGNLVQLANFEFVNKNNIYADTSAAKNTTNNDIKSCSGDALIIRTSGYANFAGVNVPNGNGTITAIYTLFKTTKQMIIRDTSDVQFNGTRCDGSSGGGSGPTTGARISIASLRSQYTGADIKIGTAYAIGGVVIATSTAGSSSSGSVVIQDGNAGITIYFGGTLNYNLGDSVVLDIIGDSLLNYKGSLELKTPFGASAPAATAANQVITPQVMTIAQLNTALATPLGSATNIENTLVKIKSVTATPSGATYINTKTLTDAAAATIAFYTKDASYGSTIMPTTCLDVVGVVVPFSGLPELKVRQAADVTTGTGCGSTPPPPPGTGLAITTSPYIQNFDGVGAGLPSGVSVKTGAKSTVLGVDAVPAFATSTATSIWTKTTGGFKNFASGTIGSTADSATQATSTNRAVGLRQVGATDSGAAFVFQLDNTTGKTNFSLQFLLQSLDPSSTRTVTWSVDYGLGDAPTTFTSVGTTGTMTTSGTFSNNTITANFGSALNNLSSKVWIRIVALHASTGSGNRPSTAIDNFQLTWN